MRWVAVVIFVVFMLGCATGIVLDDLLWRRFVLFPPGLVGSLLLTVRASRAGVTCTPGGVVAVGDHFTRRLKWSEIDHFEERGLRGIGVRLKSGSWVPVLYYATLGDVSSQKATDKLESARRRWQSPKGEHAATP